MKIRIHYTRGNEEAYCTIGEPSEGFREWVNALSASVAAGGMFCGNDFAFPARNIYYVERVED